MALKINQALNDVRSKREKVASDISMLLEREIKFRAPVGETGNLRRNSGAEVKHQEDKSVIIAGANNVEYAQVVHEGSVVKNIEGQPYIRDSIEQNIDTMKKMIREGMKTT
ncbi:HK97 gp10 family phage protein [Sutcliffiella sp. NC1]|uniref:HK97 gp10 family phage protein n=1 Tax=Sutcliffiella sp. NC1 TaxID=3004096 RepID=UPI0022DDE3DF|nr:HK97 gp10 family phage protein [Sutcliffiella sp. NC1]WBL16375.1 HK97 gp10 family phage protein [Sutcliffiella sp. NC1]